MTSERATAAPVEEALKACRWYEEAREIELGLVLGGPASHCRPGEAARASRFEAAC